MASLLESILKSAASGGVKQGNLGGLDLDEIIKSVGGQVARKQSQGVDIGDILGSVLGGQQKQAPKKSGVDIGDVLGSVLGGQKQTQTKQTGGIDLGSILGSVLGGGSASGGGISDIAKSVINVLGMASGSLKK
jgi:hypothetical protein